MKFGIGQPVTRREDDRLLRGAGRFLGDVRLPGQCFAWVVRSPVAHGTISHLDVSAAREMPGVLAVLTHAETEAALHPLVSEFPLKPAPAPVSMPHLAGETVRFVGQPVAFVVAESLDAAKDAAEMVELEIDDLPVVVDPEAALAPGAPQLHEDAPGNLAYRWECGDAAAVDKALAEAAHRVTTPIHNQRVVVASMEPRAINIRHDADTGRWEAWVSTQGAHGMRNKIAKALRVEQDRVRVHVPDVGGGFGMKLMGHPEYGLAALAAREVGRPVAWVGDRSESFLSDAQGRDMRGVVEGAFDADGKCLAMRMRTISGLGAHYSTVGVAIHTVFSATLLGGMYAIGAQHCEVRGAFTNTTPTDAYRGAGRPEAIHATERLMDEAARQLGIDRVEIRLRNFVTPEQLPHPTPGGYVFDSLDCSRVTRMAAEAADYAGFSGRASAAAARGKAAGIGVAYYMERTGGALFESTRVRVDGDGKAKVWIGTQTTGQGHATAWSQLLHDKLGIAFEDIEVLDGDSDALEVGGGTGGSRSAKMASQVLFLASDDIIEQGRKKAADMLEAAEADIEFTASGGGRFSIAGTDRAVTLAAIAADLGEITGTGRIDGRESTFPNGCHIAEVEIDRETGALAIVRYTIVDDFGTLINPLLVSGQVHGGVVQGIGQALCEQAVWDPETGQPLAASYMDYALPRAGDVPAFSMQLVEVPAKTNPLGVKGCGEAGAVGGLCATALATRDAILRAGGTPCEPPFAPQKLWKCLR